MGEKEMEIVVIEDNEDDAERIIRFLKSNISNRIRHIEDGAQALDFLLYETHSLSTLILLDLVLPSVDGLEILRRIKSHPEKRNLQVIVLVSSPETKTYIEGLNIDVDGYLQKSKKQAVPVRLEQKKSY